MSYFETGDSMGKTSGNTEEKKILGSRFLGRLIRSITDGTFTEIVEDWKWIFTYSARYKAEIAFYVILGIVGSTMSLVSSVLGKYLIDIVTGYQTDKLGILVFCMIGSSVFSIVTSSLISRISAKISVRIHNDIQADIYGKIIDADWLALSKYPKGDIMARFNGDVNTVGNNAVSWLPTIIIAVYNFIATFIVIWHYDHIMALIAFISAPFMIAASKIVLRKQREYGLKAREVSGKMVGFEMETFYNIDTIKSFGILRLYNRKMKERQEEYKDVTLEYNKFSIATSAFMSVLGLIVQMVSFLYCLFLLWNHSITYGTMTLFLQQRSALSSSFKNVVSIIPNFLSSSVSANRIRELVQLPKEVHIPESSEMDAFAEKGFVIGMENVNFSYEEGTRVITESDFIAKPGEITALIGPSGEGKTTMIRLILGLIRPESGDVRIKVAGDGAPSVAANAESRHLIAYVPQGNTMISGTIAENLRMAREDASDEEIIEALKTACAWEFVSKMKDTIDSPVRERGGRLSEGQAQRIAIARAVLRDAPILLLDEATSALDVQTERRVLKNIIQHHPNKTCIVTTHRPSVLNMCERVYRVMETHVTELSEEESSKAAMDF